MRPGDVETDWTWLIGPRHFDNVMRKQLDFMRRTYPKLDAALFDQGFIDQWGRFYTREEAMKAIKESGQPFNIERNGGQDKELFSEGLYYMYELIIEFPSKTTMWVEVISYTAGLFILGMLFGSM